MLINKITRTPVGADLSCTPPIDRPPPMTIGGTLSPCRSATGRDRPVMLSAAKHLAAHRARPFAALRVTSEGSSTSDPKRKQQEASTDEALLCLYHDESLTNPLHRRHQ